jgi:hypothetical protein
MDRGADLAPNQVAVLWSFEVLEQVDAVTHLERVIDDGHVRAQITSAFSRQKTRILTNNSASTPSIAPRLWANP